MRSSSSSSSPMAGQEEEPKWEGTATVKLQGPKPHQVWSVLVDDFCELHRWLPAVDRCRQVAGVKGEVGVVRCNERLVSGGETRWCTERLVSVDHGARCLSYQILENNVRLHGYLATMKVLPAADDGGGDEAGCRVEWSYVIDPIDWMSREHFFGLIRSHLQGMAENLEKAFPLNS